MCCFIIFCFDFFDLDNNIFLFSNEEEIFLYFELYIDFCFKLFTLEVNGFIIFFMIIGSLSLYEIIFIFVILLILLFCLFDE